MLGSLQPSIKARQRIQQQQAARAQAAARALAAQQEVQPRSEAAGSSEHPGGWEPGEEVKEVLHEVEAVPSAGWTFSGMLAPEET